MCTTCGCGGNEARIEGVADERRHDVHRHADGTVHAHPHAHAEDAGAAHGHAPGGPWHSLDDGAWHEHVRVPEHTHVGALIGRLGAVHARGLPPSRIVAIERDILAKNDAFALANRRAFAERGLFALNLVSSPGSGKTTLLVRTIDALAGRVPVAVIEGDQQTARDAERIRATGVPAVQINTGKGCHLDAHMVGDALAALPPGRGGLLFIENVGNLVCPAAFDLGEAHKVVVLSVTEGEDKPLKYPDIFHAADLLLINKIDLAPYVDFDADAAIGYARQVRPGLAAMRVSATTGEGLAAWIEWLLQGAAAATVARDRSVEALRRGAGAPEPEPAGQATGAPGA